MPIGQINDLKDASCRIHFCCAIQSSPLLAEHVALHVSLGEAMKGEATVGLERAQPLTQRPRYAWPSEAISR